MRIESLINPRVDIPSVPDLKAFLEVVKPKQTMLLMVTCVISYLIASGREIHLINFALTSLATVLAIAGTTALNMWLDSDIDALMMRTRSRPVPSGRLSPRGCAIYGMTLYSLGLVVGSFVNVYLEIVLFLGLFFDIIIYTILLKRRSPYSIVLGGFAGAMPALAGWVAVKGGDFLGGLILAAIVLLWIPAHIWYITMHYEEDYRNARIPMFPLVVGMEKASWAIVLSTVAMMFLIPSLYIVADLNPVCLVLAMVMTGYFLCNAIRFAKSPSREKAKVMYKLASVMLGIVYFSLLIGSLLG